MTYGIAVARTRRLAATVLFFLGLLALATGSVAGDVFGGGAALPAGAYVGFGFLAAGNPRLSANTASNTYSAGRAAIDSGSLFGAWNVATGNAISYCQTGSASGRKLFDNFDGVVALTSAGPCNGTTAGFAAPNGVAVDPYFASSDIPLSQAEYDQFAAGGKTGVYGRPAQFPVLASSIALVFNNPDVTATLNLADTQICNILNGSVTNWNQIDAHLPSKQIKVVYRSDGSGSTFSLANHLTASLPTAVCPPVGGHHFLLDQAFTVVVSQFMPSISTGWIGALGDGALIEAVAGTDGAIGYAGSANVRAAQLIHPALRYATVNGLDPIADFPGSITLVTLANQVLGSSGTLSLLSPAPSGTACINTVNPAVYATATTRYPIMAVSYLLANFQGNGSSRDAVRSLIASAYGAHIGVTTIGAGKGYAFLHPPLALDINSCVNT
ncbi:MAG TPA: substrate-binding domain-containing protein [Luteibacter sp.]|jgi:ABC-type phosphate transport system substrate-binding protein|nr:substrate-binding domain-containing protein [Luteibacter sp.]